MDSQRIAHYYCEIAAEAFQTGTTKQGLLALKKAMNIQADGLRQNLMLAEQYMLQAEYKKALKMYRSLVNKHPGFLSEFLDDMHRCHIQLGSEKQFINDLSDYIRVSHNLDALLLFTTLYQKDNTSEQQIAVLEDYCQDAPTAPAIMHLLAHYRDHASGKERNRYQQLYNMLSNHVSQTMKYGCTSCGYQSMTLFWQCPTCKEWGTMQPDNHPANH
jgi:lipopolysaccharide biosynthesis regulator YciM